MRRTIFICVLVLLGLAMGFYQEKLKISINYILDQSSQMPEFFEATPEQKIQWIESNRFDTPFEYYHNHATVDWLYKLNQRELVILKWVITLLFTMFFLGLNALLLRFLYVKASSFKLMLWFYAGITTVAFGLYALGILTSDQNHFYAISRKLMGALQSMVPVMIIWPAHRLWSQKNNIKTE